VCLACLRLLVKLSCLARVLTCLRLAICTVHARYQDGVRWIEEGGGSRRPYFLPQEQGLSLCSSGRPRHIDLAYLAVLRYNIANTLFLHNMRRPSFGCALLVVNLLPHCVDCFVFYFDANTTRMIGFGRADCNEKRNHSRACSLCRLFCILMQTLLYSND
jgi:hypothetical protein